MFVFVLVLLMMTPQGPRTIQIDAPSQRQCEAVAFQLRNGGRLAGQPDNVTIVDAYCVQEYEA